MANPAARASASAAAIRSNPAARLSPALAGLAILAALCVLVALPIGFVMLQAVFPDFAHGSFAHPFGAFGKNAGARRYAALARGNTVRFGVTVALLACALVGVLLGAPYAGYSSCLAHAFGICCFSRRS